MKKLFGILLAGLFLALPLAGDWYWNKYTGKLDYYERSTASPWFTTVYLYDLDLSNKLAISWPENDVADRLLRFYVNGGNRQINLSGNFTLSGNNTVALWNADDLIVKSPWADVRAYGAVGDGITNDTAAFNAAFQNSYVFIPEGEYILNALDVIDHPIHIFGTGWNTVLNFNTVSDAIKLTIPFALFPLDEGVTIENIRFKRTTNTPTSFINIDLARNTKLTGLAFINTHSTVAAIVNQSCWGLELHKCRWDGFSGTALKLLDNGVSPNYSNAINLFDCDFSNITGTAIDQQGGDLNVFGGVIENADSAGFVKLGSNQYTRHILFSGTYFEGTNSCFILAPPVITTGYVRIVLFAGGEVNGTGNCFDIGAKGRWTFQGICSVIGSPVTIKGTGNLGHYSPRVIISQCGPQDFTIDNTITDTVSVIGRNEIITPATYGEALSIKNGYLTLDNSGRNLKAWWNYEEFVGVLATGVSVGIWEFAAAGAGSSATDGVGTALRPGIFSLSTGTTNTGYAFMRAGGWTSRAAFLFGAGVYTIESDVYISGLSDGTDTYTFRFGFGDSATAAPTDGAYFYYTDIGGGGATPNWYRNTVSNSVLTSTDTGVAVVAGAWIRLKIVVNADATSVEFFIDGVSVGSNVTNIPSGAGRGTVAICSIVKSAGTTARLINIDWSWLHVNLTISR